MKLKAISCEVFARELGYAAAISPHIWDIKLMSFGLHDTPEKLRSAIQDEIDATEGADYEHIALGYGLCSRGTADIVARSIPLVIPRGHDCITVLLGSRCRYAQEFSSHPGTYYYSSGWIERKVGEVQQGFVDSLDKRAEERFREYAEKYGEDNARFLIEQETQWQANYSRAAFINTGLGDVPEYRRFVSDLAGERGWEYAEMEADLSLVTRLACGDWYGDDFLKVGPGQRVKESFDELVIKAID